MKSNLIPQLALFGLITAIVSNPAGLQAADCQLGKTWVAQGSNATEWAGSLNAAKKNTKQWNRINEWNFSERWTFESTNSDVYVISELMSDEDYVQDIYVQGVTELRVNGKTITQEPTNFYTLNLDKGLNTLEMKFLQVEEGKKPRKIALSKTTLEYMLPTTEKVAEDFKLALDYLGKSYPHYPAETYLKQLDKLVANKSSLEELDKLRHEALILNNPELEFTKILFRNSKSSRFPANWQGNSTYLRKSGKEFQPEFNDELQILDLKDGSRSVVHTGATSREGLMDICLNYSGEKFLYSGVDTETNTFEVYEMNLDGSGKRQITPSLPDIDNYNGVYLPNGKILFCSTASLNSVPCVGGSDYVGTLFEINQDGTGMRQVAFDQENDWYPWVKDNGRVMYARWEYTDNSHYFTRILMEMNPDGTANRSIYGSNSYWPNTLFYAKQIPGNTARFSAIVSGHHGSSRGGELYIFDQSMGDFEADGAVQQIPGRGKEIKPVIIDDYTAGKWPRFLHPYPVSENFFLVSCQATPNSKWELYLVDTFDNMVPLIADKDKKHQFEPIPVQSRPVPPVIPDRRIEDADGGIFFVQDIYEGPGLEGIPRGTVAALRLFTYGYAYRLSGAHDALAIEGGWDTKRVLGTVPVEEDGSVMVRVPHNMPISIQPLDKDGKALQVMRSWTVAQKGEVVSCIGCHEPSRAAPPSRISLAARKAPQDLKPWSKVDRPYGYGFKREVQPILDRYCAGCHDGTDASVPNFADNSEHRFNAKANFGNSYMALHPYVRRPGPESDLHILTPMDYHVSTSPLFQMLEKGHHGVKLADEDMRELITWVDLNVPYHATWLEVNDSDFTCEMAERTVEYKREFSGLEDDIEWMPPLPYDRPKFIQPKEVEVPPRPMKLDGWPLKPQKVAKRETLEIGDQSLDFVEIPAGKFVMGSVEGYADEYPQAVVEIEDSFMMATTEVTNALFQQFMADHDSKVIDQQWKDHIYAGYPANRPDMPAVRVTWEEAVAFTEWLSEKTGHNVTLPTEAQWEWAARAGSDKPFYFGNTGYEQHANLADKSIGFLAVRGVNPQPVSEKQRTPLVDFVPRDESFDDGILVPSGTAQFKPNPWGLYDMHGNVAEWTRSSYRAYPYNDKDGRNGMGMDERKVVRGGSWRDLPKTATASHRLMYEPYQKVYNVGIRLVIETDTVGSSNKLASVTD